jgi:UDP-N-acetylmuramyl pentapeptide phosphotransferase/UDP-N-acetylglucosamine-1-phosphate transferase
LAAFPYVEFCGAIGLGAAATWLSVLCARKLGRFDQPGARRTHQVATPRSGALGIALIVVVYTFFHQKPELWLLSALAGLGLLDDFFPQPAALRLALQFAFCSVAVYSLGDIWPSGPIILVRLALIVSAVWLVNAANFFDGRNGLLACNHVLFLLALPLLGIHWSFANALAGLWLGFLPFNFPRARIFMGDVGSYLVGATLAWLALQAAQTSITKTLSVLVLMSAMLADPTLTLLSRLSQSKRVHLPHREHLYQWLARTGVSDTKLLAIYLVYACISILMARLIVMQTSKNAVVLLLLWCATTSVVWLVARRYILLRFRRTRRIGHRNDLS